MGVRHARVEYKNILLVGIISILLFSGTLCSAEKLTLDESIRIALEGNPTVKIARENVVRTAADIAEARAEGLPKLALNHEYTRVDKPSYASYGTDLIPISPLRTSVGNLVFSQPLDMFGMVRAGRRMAHLGRMTAEYDRDKTVNDTVLAVKQAYYNVLKAQQMAAVQTDAVSDLEANLQAVKSNLKAGTVSPFEVLRAEAQVENARVESIAAENGVKQAKSIFNNLLGRDLDTVFDLEEPSLPVKIVNLPMDQCIGSACNVRPEIKSADAQVELSDKMVAVAKQGGKPKIGLNWQFDRNFTTTFDNPLTSTWNAAIQSSVALYDGGATKAAVTKAKSDATNAKLGRKLALSGLALNARQAYLNVNQNKEQIAAAEKGLQLAKEGLRLAQVRYKGGVSTQLELLDARAAMTLANKNYVNAVYDYQVSLAELENAVGGSQEMQQLIAKNSVRVETASTAK